MPCTEQSLFEQLERSFSLLTTGPNPLAVDGRLVGHGLPRRLIPLDELRALLLNPATGYTARDAALRVLIWRARAEREAAMVGLVGMVLPGLRAAARPMLRACPDHAEDVAAEIVAGLVEAVGSINVAGSKLAATLIRQAVNAGRAALGRLRAQQEGEELLGELPTPPAWPSSHPDLLLDQAVAAEVLTAQEAALISEHRVGGVALEELAARYGVSVAAMRKRRQRAERALLAWLAARRRDDLGRE